MRPLILAFIACLALAGIMEARLAQLGYAPTIVDGAELWSRERMRASRIGKNALVIIGASRIQLGLDMPTLREETGQEPVQLAVLGSSPVTVLAGLAADPTINGTILVDYYDGFAMNDTATRYQDKYRQKLLSNPLLTLGADIEDKLVRLIRENLRSFADGATPYTSLQRAWSGKPRQLYVTTMPDRSRRGDYSKVPMPAFYHANVIRSLGFTVDAGRADLEQYLQAKADEVAPVDNRQFLKEAAGVKEMIAAIEKRGGRVIFIRMPISGLIGKIEGRQFPREKFWLPFLAMVGAQGVWTEDDPVLAGFKTPDGSHLDFRDQPAFTKRLAEILGLSNRPVSPHAEGGSIR
ncbi:MAG: hypothetical protein ABI905_08285 [Betaproteobacteria bacterium]